MLFFMYAKSVFAALCCASLSPGLLVMYKKTFFASICVSIIALNSGVSSAESLRDTVSQALLAHPTIESALANRAIAEQDEKEVKSGLFPVVSASTSVGTVYANNSTSRGLTVTRGSASSGLWEANASVTQPIFDGLRTKNLIGAAQARMESLDYNVLDAKDRVVLQATQAHLGVLQAQATLDRTRTYFESIEDYLSRIELMVGEGVADESEAAQARNISLSLKSTLIDYCLLYTSPSPRDS